MNRRNFMKGLLVAGAGFSILPGAGRIWRVQRTPVIWYMTWSELIVNGNKLKIPGEMTNLATGDTYHSSTIQHLSSMDDWKTAGRYVQLTTKPDFGTYDARVEPVDSPFGVTLFRPA